MSDFSAAAQYAALGRLFQNPMRAIPDPKPRNDGLAALGRFEGMRHQVTGPVVHDTVPGDIEIEATTDIPNAA